MRRVNGKRSFAAPRSARAVIASLVAVILIIVGVGVRALVFGFRAAPSTTAENRIADERNVAEPAWRRPPPPAAPEGTRASAPAADDLPGGDPAGGDEASRFESERRDAEWAERAESDIRSAFVGFPGSVLEQVECRSSICSLVVGHGGPTAYQAWTASFAAAVKPTSRMTSKRDDQPDGTIVSKAFLTEPRQRLR